MINNKNLQYATLYQMNLSISDNKNDIHKISPSDVISLTIDNNYDSMTYSMIRFRLYLDMNIIRMICESTGDLIIRCNLDGGIYNIREDDHPVIVAPVSPIYFTMKGFIDQKNIPTNTYDNYMDGIKKKDDLNENIKAPIEIYCYHETTVKNFHKYSKSIYKSSTVETILIDLLNDCGIYDYEIDRIHNQEKYDQMLFPNLNIMQSLSMIDGYYGIHKKGTQIYCDFDNIVRIVDMDVDNGKKCIPIYVTSSKNNQDNNHGLKRINNKYFLKTSAECISVNSETDVEKVLNPEMITALNANSLELDSHKLTKLFDSLDDDFKNKIIGTPVVHKTKNKYIADNIASRINEHITMTDVSLTGIDISTMSIQSRFNLIFETPMRGFDIDNRYRQISSTHVLNQLDGNLFYAQTTMRLSSN